MTATAKRRKVTQRTRKPMPALLADIRAADAVLFRDRDHVFLNDDAPADLKDELKPRTPFVLVRHLHAFQCLAKLQRGGPGNIPADIQLQVQPQQVHGSPLDPRQRQPQLAADFRRQVFRVHSVVDVRKLPEQLRVA